MSPMDVARDRMVKYCCRLAWRAVIRDWRSMYWPVTSVEVDVDDSTLPIRWTCVTKVPKDAWGTWRTTVPDDEVPVTGLPTCTWDLATNPPSPTTRVESLVTTDWMDPWPMVSSTDPVVTTLGD